MRRVPFKVDHIRWLAAQPGHHHIKGYAPESALRLLEEAGNSYTIIVDDERGVLLCGGVIEYWKGRAEAWAVFNKACRRDFIAIHNIAKKFIDDCDVLRVEASVECGFTPGHRWARALGFELEAPRLQCYLPNGKDCSLYARIKWPQL